MHVRNWTMHHSQKVFLFTYLCGKSCSELLINVNLIGIEEKNSGVYSLSMK